MNLTEKQKEQLTVALPGGGIRSLCRSSPHSGRPALPEIPEKNSGSENARQEEKLTKEKYRLKEKALKRKYRLKNKKKR